MRSFKLNYSPPLKLVEFIIDCHIFLQAMLISLRFMSYCSHFTKFTGGLKLVLQYQPDP